MATTYKDKGSSLADGTSDELLAGKDLLSNSDEMNSVRREKWFKGLFIQELLLI